MAVEIEWIDSESARSTGNKIYRDTVPPTGKVEVADIANGNQIYQDDTAEVGTGIEYKYSIQAHDGAGDETTQEVEGENMDFIETAGASITNYVFDGGVTSYLADQAATPTMLDGIATQSHVIRLKLDPVGIGTSNRGVIGTTNGFGNTLNLELNLDNKFDGGLRDIGVSEFTNSLEVADTDWITIVFTFNASDVTFILYNGNTAIRTVADGDFSGRTSGRAFAIGGSVFPGTPLMFEGSISDYQFYNKVLSTGEVADLVTDIANTTTGLVANFAGNKTETEWTSEIGGYVLTNQGGVTTE